MKIGINACTLRGQGSSKVGMGVLDGLLTSGTQLKCVAWIPMDWQFDARLGLQLNHCKLGLAAKLYMENVKITRAAKTGEIDRLFSLTDTSVLSSPVPHLLMIQQAYLAYPESLWPRGARSAFRARMALMHAYFSAGKRTISMFTVQTVSMKNRLAAKWRIPEEKIVVVPSAVVIDAGKYASQSHSSKEPYLCFVATPSPQKNHGILPDVMFALKQRGCEVPMRLTVSRCDVPELVARAERLGVLGQFEFLGTIDKDAALGLIAGAKALFMPSTLESFGLPFYEALALGCPVVAADLDFAREALGDAGLYAPANDANAFAVILAEILGSDSLRQNLARTGIVRFASIRITWEEVARRYLNILEDL